MSASPVCRFPCASFVECALFRGCLGGYYICAVQPYRNAIWQTCYPLMLTTLQWTGYMIRRRLINKVKTWLSILSLFSACLPPDRNTFYQVSKAGPALVQQIHYLSLISDSVWVVIQTLRKQKWVCLVRRFLSWCKSLWYLFFSRVVPCVAVIHCWVCLLHIIDDELIIFIRRGFGCEALRGETRAIFIRLSMFMEKP